MTRSAQHTAAMWMRSGGLSKMDFHPTPETTSDIRLSWELHEVKSWM